MLQKKNVVLFCLLISIFLTVLFASVSVGFAAGEISVSATNPQNGAAIETNEFIVTFSEAVKEGTGFGNITVKIGDTVISTTSVIADSILTISPASGAWDDGSGNTFTVTLPFDCVIGANDINTLDKEYTFSFNTADTKAPEVVSTDPVNGATKVPANKRFCITFNEEITLIGTDPVEFSCSDPANSQTTVLLTNVSGNKLEIYSSYGTNKIWDFGKGITYTLTVKAGSIQDMNGNVLNDALTYSFTTFDNYGPKFVASDLVYDAQPLDKTITIVFDKNIFPSDEYDLIQIRYYDSNTKCRDVITEISGNTMTIKPVTQLPAAMHLYLHVPGNAIENDCGMPSYYGASLGFYTIDNIPMFVDGYYPNPSSGETGILPTDGVYVRFSKAVIPADNYDSITVTCDGAPIDNIIKIISDYDDHRLYFQQYDDVIAWDYGKTYTINIPARAVKDSVGHYNEEPFTMQFTVIPRYVEVNITNVTPNVHIFKGRTMTFYYSIDTDSNVVFEIIRQDDNMVMRKVNYSNVKAGSHVIRWNGNAPYKKDLDYGTYSVRIKAIPLDKTIASTNWETVEIRIVVPAKLNITSCPSRWDPHSGQDFIAEGTLNTGGTLSVSFYQGTRLIYNFNNTVEPSTEGTVTPFTFEWSGYYWGSTIDAGTYTVVFVLSNGPTTSKVSKTVTVK